MSPVCPWAVFWAHKSPESATKAHLCCLLFLYYIYMNLYGMSDNNSMVCVMFILIQCPQPYRKLSWDMYCTRIVTYIKEQTNLSTSITFCMVHNLFNIPLSNSWDNEGLTRMGMMQSHSISRSGDQSDIKSSLAR